MIRDIYTGWPGSTHDVRVFRNSALFAKAEAGNCLDIDKIIIADSEYSLKCWLITMADLVQTDDGLIEFSHQLDDPLKDALDTWKGDLRD